MAEQSLTWTGTALTQRLKAAQIAGVNRTMGASVNHAKMNHPWQNQTGILEGDIQIQDFAVAQADGVRGVWGVRSESAQARILELGGTIYPKNAKFLTVPISDEAKAAGRAGNMSNLAYVQSLKGQPMLVDQHTGKVHWLLMRSVTIKAHPYLRPAADVTYPKLADNIRKAYEKAGGDSAEGNTDGG